MQKRRIEARLRIGSLFDYPRISLGKFETPEFKVRMNVPRREIKLYQLSSRFYLYRCLSLLSLSVGRPTLWFSICVSFASFVFPRGSHVLINSLFHLYLSRAQLFAYIFSITLWTFTVSWGHASFFILQFFVLLPVHASIVQRDGERKKKI